MNSTRYAFSIGALFVALCPACSASLDVPPEALISCAGADDCPPGWVCRPTGRCVSSDNLDEDAPAFLAEPTILPARASRVPGHDRVEVAFTLDEDVSKAPARLDVRVGDTALECETTASARAFAHRCGYRLSGSDSAGPQAVAIVAADRAGNVAERNGVVEFDFDPPKCFRPT